MYLSILQWVVYISCYLQGCLSARGERILMLDADGATAIADLEQLEKAMDKLTKDHVRTYMCVRVL